MRKLIVSFMAVTFLAACSPKVTSSLVKSHQALPSDAEVVVLEENQAAPADAESLGRIKIGDTGFTSKSGTYEAVLNLAKEQARQAGGNVVKITEHKSPDFYSSIHRVKAEVFRVDDLSVLRGEEAGGAVSAHPDYAVIYFWRSSGVGTLVSYDVYVGDKKVYRSKPGTKAEVKVYEEGDVEIWAKTEAKEVIPLTVRKGEDYYVRTAVTMGVLVGRPSFEKISAGPGKIEYESVKGRK